MSIDKLNFNPVTGWESEIDFPNYQDEASNREMMNKLHFQTKDFINNLITILESTEGASEIGSYAIEGLTNLDESEAITVKAQLEALKRLVDTKPYIDEVYSKEDIDSKVDMVDGAIKSINDITSTKGNISIIAGAGIRIEVDNDSKAIRVISTGTGTGDMLKEQYDADGDGIVDDSAKLGGKSADTYYNLGVPTQTIPSGADLDSYTTEGVYKNSNNYSGNQPVKQTGKLTVECLTNSSRVFQTYIPNDITNHTYQRQLFNGTWTEWQRVAYTDNISNPNLLINGDFRVNQRNGYYVKIGAVVYNDTALTVVYSTTPKLYNVTYVNDTYCILNADGVNRYVKTSDCVKGYVNRGYMVDMWQLNQSVSLVVTINDGYINLNNVSTDKCWLYQKIEGLPYDTYTLSIKTDDGIYSKTVTFNGTAIGNTTICDGLMFNFGSVDSNGSVTLTLGVLPEYSFNIHYVKLELGNVATPYSPRPYGEELALCQRYLDLQRKISTNPIVYTADTLYFLVPLNTSLKSSPTLVGTPNNGINVIKSGGTVQTDFTFTIADFSGNAILVCARKTSHGLSQTNCQLIFTDGNGFSAEL